ncbi:MAG: ring-cleaving dioxygenase [Thermoanaerobaculia bacterium]|nr:ring-cleaving dioxygenase [Thermoanaerobaculia bacterium]
MESRGTRGLHHITAIAGPAQENLDFYAGVLGMKLVKKSVNQDDPGTYHLFYADAEGRPGTDLTFFPWAHLAPSRPGHGLASEVALAVAPDSLAYWAARLESYGVPVGAPENRFGDPVLALIDPHGLRVALVESASAAARPFTPWEGGPVPVERQIRGLDGARVGLRQLGPTEALLAAPMGLTRIAEENGWVRWGIPDDRGSGALSGARLDLAHRPDTQRGMWGTGAVHHLAWRVDDEAHELALRAAIAESGPHPTPVIDRFWFKSVYFKEPGGVLFELATDGPGFAVDEAIERLGETLVLPPWLEPQRAAIAAALPALTPPAASS